MGRQRRQTQESVLEGLFELLKVVPAWVGPVLAVIAFVVCRFLIPLIFPSKDGSFDAASMIRSILVMLSWFVAGGILLIWIIAQAWKLFNPSTGAAASQSPGGTPTSSAPRCPTCGCEMALRTARKGAQSGSQFWGCPKYPACRGTRPC